MIVANEHRSYSLRDAINAMRERIEAEDNEALSDEPHPAYRVRCWQGCGYVNLSTREYTRQMMDADNFWQCPDCGGRASFDDANYERHAWPDVDDCPTDKDWQPND